MEKDKKTIPLDETDEKLHDISTSLAAGKAAKAAADRIEQKYAKAQEYDRHNYDDGAAKYRVKREAFKKGKGVVKDPYTNKRLTLTKKEAKLKYGKNYAAHMSEADHTVPLKVIHKYYKNNPFISQAELKEIANSDDNLIPVSRLVNNAKRAKTNKEFADRLGMLKKKGLPDSDKIKAALRWEGAKAEIKMDVAVAKKTVQNAAGTFHEVGAAGGVSAGVMVGLMSSINNFGQALAGDKEVGEAFRDIAKDTGKAVINGYMRAGGIGTATQIMRSSTQELIKTLGKRNAPAQILTAVSVAGDALSRYCSGEIDMEECMLELQKNAASLAASSAGMALGETVVVTLAAGAVVSVPVLALVGAAVGAMAATAIVGFVENVALAPYYKAKAARQIEERRSAAFNRVTAAMEAALAAQGKRLDAMHEQEKERQYDAFYLGFEQMMDSALANDADEITAGLNRILSYFGEECYFEDREAFNQFFDSKDRKTFVL